MITDLGTLGGKETSPSDIINVRGQIVCVSTTKSGTQRAVLWTLKR